ncbi:hypothetical protein DSL92_04215 [Billgrantia gudaonensis]|uniref:Uncharacterized protein n=1 Tax=Billgrantia gudaonensis TaxID=376427 RepID=A0A432JKF1_9GAMM|nr:hypothetical protein DSL92_04215 [Halomonas gudaonensis]
MTTTAWRASSPPSSPGTPWLRDLAGTAEWALVVGLVGEGHLRFGHGVPHQLRDLGLRPSGFAAVVGPRRWLRGTVQGLAQAVFAIAETPERASPHMLGVALVPRRWRRDPSHRRRLGGRSRGAGRGDVILRVAGESRSAGLTRSAVTCVVNRHLAASRSATPG